MRAGSLFSGYGGLDLAVEEVFDAELAWYSEFEEAPSKIMARHWPGIPNHGDVTQIDWSTVEPVDIISGGSPCQDVSAAGRRAGMTEGTRSNLWVAMREAIATIKPTYVVWENVRGAHSARAYSEVESEPGLLGDTRGAYLRATGRVLGDLADLGFDAEWRTISASSVGAPHKRERVFVLAWRRDIATNPLRTTIREHPGGSPAEETRAAHGHRPRHPGGERPAEDRREAQRVALLPTPRASHADKGGPNQRDSKGHYDLPAIERLLPTPQANLADNGGSQHPDKRRAGGHSVSIADVVEHLLPTPTTGNHRSATAHRHPDSTFEPGVTLGDIAHLNAWGEYSPSIERWERILGRPSPAPTVLSAKGKHRLSHYFTEFMQGLPLGWICDTPGVTPNESIRAAGNGVVTQQATAALRDMARYVPPRLGGQP